MASVGDSLADIEAAVLRIHKARLDAEYSEARWAKRLMLLEDRWNYAMSVLQGNHDDAVRASGHARRNGVGLEDSSD